MGTHLLRRYDPYELKPRKGPLAGFILPRPNHASGYGMRKFSLRNDTHPLAGQERKTGLDFHASEGKVDSDR